jgi:hypothetical protein
MSPGEATSLSGCLPCPRRLWPSACQQRELLKISWANAVFTGCAPSDNALFDKKNDLCATANSLMTMLAEQNHRLACTTHMAVYYIHQEITRKMSVVH